MSAQLFCDAVGAKSRSLSEKSHVAKLAENCLEHVVAMGNEMTKKRSFRRWPPIECANYADIKTCARLFSLNDRTREKA